RLMACWRFLLNPSCCLCSSLVRLFWSHRSLCSDVCKCPRRNLVPIFGFMPTLVQDSSYSEHLRPFVMSYDSAVTVAHAVPSASLAELRWCVPSCQRSERSEERRV